MKQEAYVLRPSVKVTVTTLYRYPCIIENLKILFIDIMDITNAH